MMNGGIFEVGQDPDGYLRTRLVTLLLTTDTHTSFPVGVDIHV